MGTNNIVFLEVIEFFDATGKKILQRIPEQGSGEIKFGAQLIVRPIRLLYFFTTARHTMPLLQADIHLRLQTFRF